MEIVVNGIDPNPQLADLAYWAWTIICNVSEGDWGQQPEEWQAAAVRFRDEYHALISKMGK